MKYSGNSAAVRPYPTIHKRAIGRDGSPCCESFRAILMQIVTGPCDFQADLNGESHPFNLCSGERTRCCYLPAFTVREARTIPPYSRDSS